MRNNLKKLFIKIIYNLNYKLLMKNIILFESNPDYSDSAYYVFQECINRGINNKCKLVWLCLNYDKNKKYPKYKNVKFVNRRNKSIMLYYCIFSKYICDCNSYVYKFNKNQFRIHLRHGIICKQVDDYLISMGKTDCYIVESDNDLKTSQKIYDKYHLVDNYIKCGSPRNDTFFIKENKYKFYPNINRKKTILWLPTYRQHKNLGSNDMYNMKDINFPLGIPCFDNIDELKETNEYLKQKKVLLIIKPHPAQDISNIKNIKLSNIKIINDTYFKNFTNLYHYLPNVDALITDYSSVYFDFLYANKPIGLAIPDFELYTSHVKPVYDYNKTVIGEKILTNEDLKTFIKNISEGKDIMYKKRIKTKYYNKKGNASKKIVNLLEEKMR